MKLYSFCFILFFFLFDKYAVAQGVRDLHPVIDQMCELESNRDAKCHATASRLEDFIYGTPLSFEARNDRIEFQKNYVRTIWQNYAKALKQASGEVDKMKLLQETESTFFTYKEDFLGISLYFPDNHKIFLTERDHRQYSSVAYAYRAILSVQQSNLFESEKLPVLENDQITYIKKSVDFAVLALLSEADQLARKENKYQIEKEHIVKAIRKLFESVKAVVPSEMKKESTVVDQKTILYDIIEKKLAAYRNYNQINQKVFLRNIQVYFAKIPWPSDAEESRQLRSFYTENLIQLTADMLNYAEQLAIQQRKNVIEYQEVYATVQAYMPHTINQFEDVTYFPKLGQEGKIVIEAYDLDAFRDSGLHWQYLKFALNDKKEQFKAVPDAFALEMLVEGVAQFAVLLFREAGNHANALGQTALKSENILFALKGIQQKINLYNKAIDDSTEANIISKESSKKDNTEAPFSEISEKINLNFYHKNSDWLNRKIRSYVVKDDENLARLGIPPAFGGGGVAAEDIDNDGWVDILLLGGRGNQLFKNIGGKSFKNITKSAGISWQRPDGNYGEPRQPIIADFDNDGWQDIFISYANDKHRIYRNNGDGTFEDMTEQANFGGEGLVGGPCTAFDFDKDGLLDIYIGYFGNYLKGELPTLKRHNTNGTPNKLFKNTGSFIFKDVSTGSRIENSGWTQAVGHSDFNRDGWQDLIVGNDFGTNSYYLNNQDGTFTDVSKEIGTDKPSYTMNVGIGDLNRDMHPDFYISNIVVMEKDDKYVLPNEDTKAHFDPSSLSTMRVVEANDLFISSIEPNGNLKFTKSKSVGRGFSSTGWSWDADFFDYDNDGDDDLYCLTGMNPYAVYGQENEYYQSPDGDSANVTFAKSQEEPNIFFENKNGHLEVLSNTGGLNYSGTSRSAAYLDFDNDGDLDIVVNEYQGEARFFENHSEKFENHWGKIKLTGDYAHGMTKDAIGTSLIITLPDGEKFWKEIHSTTGYLSGHPKEIHFGLGLHKKFDLEIIWPNGNSQTLKNLDANQSHQVNYEY